MRGSRFVTDTCRWFTRIVCVAGATLVVANCVWAQALMEQQTSNNTINGLDSWNVSAGTAPEQVSVNNGYLSIGGIGGAGQFFGVNGRSRYQIAKCIAVKASSWAGFGVTYYDAAFNEVGVQSKEITADLRFGGNASLYSIGLVPPPNAVFAYLWIWNNDPTGYVIAQDFKALNYFPYGDADFNDSNPLGNRYTQTFPADRNLIINGSFETNQRAINFADPYEGDEFWNVIGSDDSVFYQRSDGLGGPTGLRIGSVTETNVIYQTVPDVQAGQPYTLEVSFLREFATSSECTPAGCNLPSDVAGAVAGVDFFDSNWNKLGDQSVTLRQFENFDAVNFTPPSETAHTVVWVWVEQNQEPGEQTIISSLSITPSEFEPPTFELLGIDSSGTPVVATFRITDNEEVDLSTVNFTNFVYVGPDGEEIATFHSRPPNGPSDQHRYSMFAPLVSGTYSLFYNNGTIKDVAGNATFVESTLVGTFQVE